MKEDQIKYILKLPSGAASLGEMIMRSVFSGGFVVEELPEGSILFKGFADSSSGEKSRLWSELQTEVDACSEEILQSGGYVLRRVKEEKLDWVEKWKESFKPHRVGDSWVVIPAWEAGSFEYGDERYPIFIEPGVAFGSGNHPSTRLALNQLSHLASEFNNLDSLLDVGCGSGIISIAGARLGFSSITAVDIDELSVENTRTNLKLNDLTYRVEVIKADINEVAEDLNRAELVVINCLPRIIADIFQDLDELLLPGGFALVSGFKAKHTEMIENELNEIEIDLSIHSRNREDDWRSLTVKRSGDRDGS